MSALEQLSLELYKMQLGDYIKYTGSHKAYLCCVNRLEGPQTDLALYARYLPVKSQADRCFYRDFLKAIPQLGELELHPMVVKEEEDYQGESQQPSELLLVLQHLEHSKLQGRVSQPTAGVVCLFVVFFLFLGHFFPFPRVA